MMEGVVERGTGTRAAINGYSVAGKTGTAQKIDPRTGAYDRHKYIASFSGFAPVNNPALTVLVVLDAPIGPHEGGEVAAPVFARVAQQALAYWNVAHDREVQDPRQFALHAKARKEDVTESSPEHLDAEETRIIEPLPQPAPTPQATMRETKTVAAESPLPEPASAPRQGAVILNVAGGVQVPDFSGKSLRAALEEAEEAGLELDASGSGIAQSQSPAAGSHIAHGAHVSVRFGR